MAKGVRVGPFSLRNGTALSYTGRIFPVLLGQTRDGSVIVRDSAAAQRRARRYMRLSSRRFSFPPAAVQSVRAQVTRVPRAGGLYAGALFQAKPIPSRTAPQLGRIFRLAASIFLHPPARLRDVQFEPEQIRVEQAGPRKLRFVSAVENRGNYYAPLGGVVRVTNRSGRTVLRTGLERIRILPEAVVDLTAVTEAVLPVGSYGLTADLRSGKKRWTAHGSMRLLGPSTVAFRDATLSAPKPPKAYFGHPVEFEAQFRNTGNVAFKPRATVEVQRTGGRIERPLRSVDADAERVDPNERGEVTADVRLPDRPATYQLTVRLYDGNRELDSASTTVTPTKKPALLERITDSIEEHALAWVLVLVAVLAAAIAGVAVYARALGRRAGAPADVADAGVPVAERRAAPTETAPVQSAPPPVETASAVAPASTAPNAASGQIDVNVATVEELMTLPGIGRRAAQRIVEQREATGRFERLEDLQAIEGFHSARIEQLRPHACV